MRILILKNRFWFSGGDFTSWVQSWHLGTAKHLENVEAVFQVPKGEASTFTYQNMGARTTSGWPVKGRYWVQLSLQGLWSGVEEWGGRWMLGRGKKRKGEGSQGGGRFSRVLMLLCDWRMNLQTGPCGGAQKGLRSLGTWDLPGTPSSSHDPAALGLLSFPTIPGRLSSADSEAATDEGECPAGNPGGFLHWWRTRLPRKPGVLPSSLLGRTRFISPAFPNWHLPLPLLFSEAEALLNRLSLRGTSSLSLMGHWAESGKVGEGRRLLSLCSALPLAPGGCWIAQNPSCPPWSGTLGNLAGLGNRDMK